VILQALSCARTSIKIMTPYFLPDERIITALSLAAYRGVEVDLVLPSTAIIPPSIGIARTDGSLTESGLSCLDVSGAL